MSDDLIELLRGARAPDLELDPYAVLAGGRRRRQRRRILQVTGAVGGVAAGVAVALTLNNPLGQESSTTPAPGGTSTIVVTRPVVAPTDPSTARSVGPGLVEYRATESGVEVRRRLADEWSSWIPIPGPYDDGGSMIHGDGADYPSYYLVTASEPVSHTFTGDTPTRTEGGLTAETTPIPGTTLFGTTFTLGAADDSTSGPQIIRLSWKDGDGRTHDVRLPDVTGTVGTGAEATTLTLGETRTLRIGSSSAPRAATIDARVERDADGTLRVFGTRFTANGSSARGDFSLSLGPGESGAFVNPGEKVGDVVSTTPVFAYGIVRAGATAITPYAGDSPMNTRSFDVHEIRIDGTDRALVVLAVDARSALPSPTTVRWADGARTRTAPLVVPGG